VPDTHFPGETSEYRTARNELLRAEIALRDQTEDVARLRRALPPGGTLKEDYVFQKLDGAPVRVSELFQPGKDTLAIYSYMYGPEMKAPCPLCTSILDGLDGQAPHIMQRVNFAVAAKSPPARINDVARRRGWRNLPLLSSATNTYNIDYHGENEKGAQFPMLNVFARRDGGIDHVYATEMFFAPKESGIDGRHVDSIWPLWNMFDFTPDGRGTDWYPKLEY
jgi:predicted dithiol-disulfide oxidoreductase (DUF899 family)